MKILTITNFYPPFHVSGYAMLCFDVVESLRKRGHNIKVLTSTLGVKKETIEDHVYRLLTLESDLNYYQPLKAISYPFYNKRNLTHLRKLVQNFHPDIIFLWGMWNLSKELAEVSEILVGSRAIYYLANPWPIEQNLHKTYWEMPARRSWTNLIKHVLLRITKLYLRNEWRPLCLQFYNAACCSRALYNQLIYSGIPLKNAPIIYEGIDLRPYVKRSERSLKQTLYEGIFSFVYVGLLVEHKGVHSAIEALAKLTPEELKRVRLTILGSGHPEYEVYLKDLTFKYNLSSQVVFQPPIPRSELPEFLANFDALLLPSIWEEPLALIMQEGLASGLIVIGTATGGTKEIITDGFNGLLFQPDDSSTLANHIVRILSDPSLRKMLAENGKKTAFEKFDLTRMINEVEDLLIKVNETSLSY
jgi:glycogen(starch) synthase